MPTINLYNTDCMEFMRNVPDKHYELAIVDPPYGIGFSSFNRTNKDSNGKRYKANKYKNSDWDIVAPTQEYFSELFRISKQQIIWGGNYFGLPPNKCFIFWYKQNPVPNFSDGEYAWTSFEKPAACFNYRYYGSLEGNTSATDKINPTQKPVALYKWLLKNYAKQGDKILDTHGGSMSIAIACHDLGFDLDLCELDKDYYQAGVKRYNLHTSQQKLFV